MSLVAQRLRLCASTAGGTSLIPGWGTKFPHVLRHKTCGIKKKKKQFSKNPNLKKKKKILNK